MKTENFTDDELFIMKKFLDNRIEDLRKYISEIEKVQNDILISFDKLCKLRCKINDLRGDE